MSVNVKRILQDIMVGQCYREYSRELKKQQAVYDVFMRKQETRLRKRLEACETKLTAKVLTGREFVESLKGSTQILEDIVIVTATEGILHPLAEQVILNFFEEHKECSLVYADEDVCLSRDVKVPESFAKKGVDYSERCYPNLKPVPAPETFLSFQYFGSIWAVRTGVACDIECLDEKDTEVVLYDFLFKVWEKVGTEGIRNIPEILFHRFESIKESCSREEMEQYLREQDIFHGYREKYHTIKKAHLSRLGIEADLVTEGGYGYPIYKVPKVEKVSILIPSKDNPKVLETCISSIRERSTYASFEIIVIDNGSKEENKAYIQELSEKYDFKYLYRPMEFNYSVMNNIAAQNAEGEILLLLNDDMEVITPDWLERMVGQVMQAGIGAVGAKLLYPDTTLIQHVGVTNAVDGPVHKLLKMSDEQSYNHGRNKLVYNVLGVTGACLMVRKEHFDRLGGLNEDLRIAYNDVDFCFSLYESGLRNVVRNDVVLYHHESLSRGSDALSAEKLERLKYERGLLYRKHPELYAVDPYEGANNSGGAQFGLVQTDEEESLAGSKWQEYNEEYAAYPPGVLVGMDYCEKHEFIRIEDKDTYVIQGFALLPEGDNCRYCFELVLSGTKKSFVTKITKKLRPNMAEGVPNASNVEMTGFVCYIVQGDLPADEYKVGIFAKDKCSRQRLFQETDFILRIDA